MILRFFFERWWLLCGVLVAVELVSFAVWARRRTTRAARMTWITLAAAVALPVISHLVVTRRERIEMLCRDLAHMVDVGDVQSLATRLADDFEAAGLTRDEFLSSVARALSRYRVDHPSLHRMSVTFPRSGEAVAVFDTVCSIRWEQNYLDRLFSRWQVELIQTESGWRVITIEAIPSPLSPIRNLRDFLRS